MFVVPGFAFLVAVAVPALGAESGLAASPGHARSLGLAGCDANVPIIHLMQRAFTKGRPDVTFHVRSLGSTAGIALTAAGTIDVGLVSREVREAERALGLAFRAYARTPIVFAADPAVPENDLTIDDLRQIYLGTKTRWANGREIVLVTREEGNGSIDSMRKALPGFARAYAKGAKTHHWTVTYSELAMHEALLTFPFALGLSDLGTIAIERLPVKALSVGGAAPALQTLASGRYPLVKTLGFVWREDRVSPLARAFMQFVLSDAGAAILAAHGYLPAR